MRRIGVVPGRSLLGSLKTVVVDQAPTDGGQTADYAYPRLKAGSYVFLCTLHPGMTGTLTVS